MDTHRELVKSKIARIIAEANDDKDYIDRLADLCQLEVLQSKALVISDYSRLIIRALGVMEGMGNKSSSLESDFGYHIQSLRYLHKEIQKLEAKMEGIEEITREEGCTNA